MDIRPEYLVEQFHMPFSCFDPTRQRSDKATTVQCSASETPIGSDTTDFTVGSATSAVRHGDTTDQVDSRAGAERPGTTMSQPMERRRSRKRRPTYIDRSTDKAGRQHLYYRRRRRARIPLHGDEGTSEFEASYRIAQRIDTLFWRISKRQHPPRRTLEALAVGYFKSDRFAALAPASRAAYRRSIQNLMAHVALRGIPVNKLTRAHVERLLMTKAGTPTGQADAVKKLRLLFRVAMNRGWCNHDPTDDITLPNCNQRIEWSTGEIAIFEARWPTGTRERLAFDLLRRAGFRGHKIVGVTVDNLAQWNIPPAHPPQPRREQPAAIGGLKYALTTGRGRPFSAAGFGKFMARAIADAGLPTRCVADSLRLSRSRVGGGP